MQRQRSKCFHSSSFFQLCIFLGAGLFALQAAEPPARLHSSLESGERFRLAGSTRPMVAVSKDQGAVDASLPLSRMTLHFSMTTAQQADLQQLLQQQVTRHSSQYHQWLTPEAYAERFGVNSSDLQKVTAWLEKQGFTDVQAARSRSFISFSGNAAQAQAAFQTSIHSYLVNGETHYANNGDPLLPKALQGMVAGLRGLNDLRPKPHSIAPAARPHFTSSITGLHFLTPDDFATIYGLQALYGSGIDGTGQKIAIPGQSDINLADIQAFRTAAGLAANPPQVILYGSDPGTRTSYEGEADLDVEWAGGVAKNATIIYVNSQNAFDALTYAIDQNLAPVISVTYGDCESNYTNSELNSYNLLFQQASAQGVTILAASGDSGAGDCEDSTATATSGPQVDFPGSSPYVTSVGGTTFSEGSGSYWNTTNDQYGGSAISYIPEVAWNDTSSVGTLEASGGGASAYFSKPSWQVGTGVPNDGKRDVPDVAFAASPQHDGYLVCEGGGDCTNGFRQSNSDLDPVGGTSASTPSFAAIIALLNQKTNTTQGNINPELYSLASYAPNAFQDITSGNNIVPCTAGSTGCPTTAPLQFGFSAGVGYDQVTGLGSVNGDNLVNDWTGDFGISISPATLALTRGTPGTATVTIAKDGNFNGTVSFTCSVAATLTNTTCSIPGTVTGSGTATLTISPGATASTPLWRHFEFPGTRPPWLPAAGAGLFALSAAFLFAKRRHTPALAVAGTLSLMLVMASCGDGGGSSTSSTLSSTPTLTLAAAPSTLTLAPGQSGTSTATVTTGGSFSGSVALSVSGAPAGVTATLGSTSVSGSSSVPVTIATTSAVAAGTYPLTITAQGSNLTATATVTLTVSGEAGNVTVTATSGTLTYSTTIAVTLN